MKPQKLKWKRKKGVLTSELENGLTAKITQSAGGMHFRVEVGAMWLGNKATEDLGKELVEEFLGL